MLVVTVVWGLEAVKYHQMPNKTTTTITTHMTTFFDDLFSDMRLIKLFIVKGPLYYSTNSYS